MPCGGIAGVCRTDIVVVTVFRTTGLAHTVLTGVSNGARVAVITGDAVGFGHDLALPRVGVAGALLAGICGAGRDAATVARDSRGWAGADLGAALSGAEIGAALDVGHALATERLAFGCPRPRSRDNGSQRAGSKAEADPTNDLAPGDTVSQALREIVESVVADVEFPPVRDCLTLPGRAAQGIHSSAPVSSIGARRNRRWSFYAPAGRSLPH